MPPPSSILYHAYLLELLIADCPTWQLLTGTANRADAQQYIHYPWASPNQPAPQKEPIPPRCIISDEADVAPWSLDQVTFGGWAAIETSHQFSFDIPVPDDVYAQGYKEAGWYVLQVLGDLILEMSQLSGRGVSVPGTSHLNCQTFRKVDGPFELDMGEEGADFMDEAGLPRHIWHMTFSVEWK